MLIQVSCVFRVIIESRQAESGSPQACYTLMTCGKIEIELQNNSKNKKKNQAVGFLHKYRLFPLIFSSELTHVNFPSVIKKSITHHYHNVRFRLQVRELKT